MPAPMVKAFASKATDVELAALGTLLEQTLESNGLVATDGVDRVLALNDFVVLLAADVQTSIGKSSFCQLAVAKSIKKDLVSIGVEERA